MEKEKETYLALNLLGILRKWGSRCAGGVQWKNLEGYLREAGFMDRF